MKLSRKSRFWIGGVLLAIGLSALLFSVYRGPFITPITPPLPIPNGYDDFIAAGKLRANLLSEVPMPRDPDFKLESARKYVASFGPVLDRLKLGLNKSSAVPVAFTTNWLDDHLQMLAEEKRLALSLALAGFISEQEGELHEAAGLYMQGLNFGSAVGHGGLLIDTMVAVADERIALSYLDPISSRLSATDCRYVLGELERWKTNREPFEFAADRERRWADIYGRLYLGALRSAMERIAAMIAAKSLHPQALVIVKTKTKYVAVVDQAQGIEMRIAMRAFELEHKSAAKGWGDLVPAYLPEIPTNSTTGRPLTHQFSN